jgi:pimeloyl-ACP methyl ester carboxylesterase
MKLFGKILAGLAVLSLAYFAYWRYDHTDREHRVTEAALTALESDARVTITQDEWIVFEPITQPATKGLIFYPGGEVDERGYAEPLHHVASAGYLVVIVPMPFQLAVFAIDSATDVIEAYPEIDSWAIAGHSLGGSMAAYYAADHPDSINGLLFWDAYAANDMTASKQAVRMIHRSDENGDPPAGYGPNLANHPQQTDYVPLVGGSHLNFGNFIAGRIYRDEPEPELDGDVQRGQVAVATIEFMNSL